MATPWAEITHKSECPGHEFETCKDGIDRCTHCKSTFLEATRGFGSNVTPKVRRTKPLRGL